MLVNMLSGITVDCTKGGRNHPFHCRKMKHSKGLNDVYITMVSFDFSMIDSSLEKNLYLNHLTYLPLIFIIHKKFIGYSDL